MAPGAVDWHAHWVPPALHEALRARTHPPCIVREADGAQRLCMPIGALAFDASYVDMAQRLRFMDALGIERQVLSLPGLFGLDSLPVEQSVPLLSRFNDDLAALCRAQPGRFSGLAALPLADPACALREFERGRTELGLIGAILPVDGFRSEAAVAALRPLLALGQALGAHFFVHPGRVARAGPVPAPAQDHVLARRALAVQAEVGEAMVTLLMSDLLDSCPDVTVQVANLGGTFTAAIERIEHAIAVRTPRAPQPLARARRVWVDCASLGASALEQAVAVFGAGRVLLGTDCPIFDTARTLSAIKAARLDDAQRRAILRDNAQALLASHTHARPAEAAGGLRAPRPPQ